MLRYNLIPTFKEINLSKYMKVWSPPSECDYIDCIESERARQEDADICANCNCDDDYTYYSITTHNKNHLDAKNHSDFMSGFWVLILFVGFLVLLGFFGKFLNKYMHYIFVEILIIILIYFLWQLLI